MIMIHHFNSCVGAQISRMMLLPRLGVSLREEMPRAATFGMHKPRFVLRGGERGGVEGGAGKREDRCAKPS